MNILTAEHITKAYGVRKLLDDASFYLQEGEKVGIIGINGTGKSTLLKILSGIEECDEGRVIYAQGMVVRFLPQHPVFEPEETQLEAVLRENQRSARDALFVSEAKSMMMKLGITDFEEKCGHLSGGQKKRLALISILLSNADVLVLDEPTNHLDGEMAQWLEDTLRERKTALIMVTHDRYFLDSVTERIVELDKGKLYSYEANYSGYLELKLKREEMELATERKNKSLYRTELEWVKRGARARTTKQKARLERFEELKNRKTPESARYVELGSVVSRMGRTTIEIEHLKKSFGEKQLIEDFTYIFLKNDRVGFVGKNGCGKTTLMKMICGMEEADAGSITIGQTIKIGYYAQECVMDDSKRVIDYIRDVAEIIDTPEGKITASRMLEKFLFSGEDQYGPVGKLSGGEKRRLSLCRVLMEAPNVLILDEPTNDLDIATLTILESYLDTFPGIVITVSHDRFFLDRIVHRIFAFENGNVVQYEGNYSDYLLRKSMEEYFSVQAGVGTGKDATLESPDKPQAKSAPGTWQKAPRKLKFSYKEQKEYETIETDIANIEEQIAALEEEIPKFASNFVKLQEISAKKETLQAELDEKMDRWMYLEDLAARIEAGETIS